jgi:hypothetical protein
MTKMKVALEWAVEILNDMGYNAFLFDVDLVGKESVEEIYDKCKYLLYFQDKKNNKCYNIAIKREDCNFFDNSRYYAEDDICQIIGEYIQNKMLADNGTFLVGDDMPDIQKIINCKHLSENYKCKCKNRRKTLSFFKKIKPICPCIADIDKVCLFKERISI